jgi:hypothetical protein
MTFKSILMTFKGCITLLQAMYDVRCACSHCGVPVVSVMPVGFTTTPQVHQNPNCMRIRTRICSRSVDALFLSYRESCFAVRFNQRFGACVGLTNARECVAQVCFANAGAELQVELHGKTQVDTAPYLFLQS